MKVNQEDQNKKPGPYIEAKSDSDKEIKDKYCDNK